METKKTEDMTEYFRNCRVKNKDKLAPYMSNYMKVYYGDRKDKFYEYKKHIVKKNSYARAVVK